jgi:hypothetical protein
MSAVLVKEYDAHLDAKKRVTLRDAQTEYYAVKVFSDGRVMMEPRVLVSPEHVSKRSLKMLEASAKNFKAGKVSEPIDLDAYL